jgi:hypothetical protein
LKEVWYRGTSIAPAAIKIWLIIGKWLKINVIRYKNIAEKFGQCW